MSEIAKETILIVDDNPVNLRVIANCLSKAGYKVLAADDGLSAIELVESSKPNIILLDVMMPGIDGYETCERLKATSRTRDIPILFLTARSETTDKVKGFQVGGADYITKPYQEAEVLARVKTHLTISRQRAELDQMLKERERFMKIAAHDLRNPLSVIIFIATMEWPASEVVNAFSKIERAASQMKAIIDDFLSLQILQEKIEGAKAMDLKHLVEQVIEQQSSAAKAKGITLKFESSSDSTPASGSTGYAHQILTNYVSNAIKYSPLQTQVVVSTISDKALWRVEVKDQGPGVPAKERDQLFTEFARISNKPTAGETSTRLGLSVVKKLAETIGGRAGASFPDSGGSVFWFEVPKALPQ